MVTKITSTANPAIKNLLHLIEKPRARKEQHLFVIEGSREIGMAILGKYRLMALYYCPALIDEAALSGIIKHLDNTTDVVEISVAVFNRLAYRADSGGVIALAEPAKGTLSYLTVKDNPIYLFIETVEKQGNLGALLRTADAAAVDGVIVCDTGTDLYNPNVIRSSIGCLFTLPLVICTSQQAIDWLKKSGINICATFLHTTSFYHQADFNKPTAIVMGAEATGISKEWVDQADSLVKIPMMGMIDSMNVSVAAAIVIFEARRQRNFR